MAKIIPTFKFSRIFLLSLTFLIFITFIVVTIFSSFIFNNSRIQQIESLYIQAKTIDTLIPQIDEKDINFDEIADSLSITDSDDNELRITIINEDWQVIGDSLVEQQNLSNVELHSPETELRLEMQLTVLMDLLLETVRLLEKI